MWVDCEMTGLDPESDRLLEVAVLVTDRDLGLVAEGPDLCIRTPREVLDAMGDWCTRQHGESGLTQECLRSELATKTLLHRESPLTERINRQKDLQNKMQSNLAFQDLQAHPLIL